MWPGWTGRPITQKADLGDKVVETRSLIDNVVTSGKLGSGAVIIGGLGAYAVGSGYVASGAVRQGTLLAKMLTNYSLAGLSGVESHNLGVTPQFVFIVMRGSGDLYHAGDANASQVGLRGTISGIPYDLMALG